MTKDWLKDKNTGEKFYPITHQDAVIDNNGTTLSTKLTTAVKHTEASTISGDLAPSTMATAVSTAQQSLTDAEKGQVMINLGLAKYGIISQTQTATKAQDNGYDWTMSNKVYGYIPQANIDLFSTFNAVFNSSTGYFELNGLTDIAYDEMLRIYGLSETLSYYTSGDMYLGNYTNPKVRTLIPAAKTIQVQGSYARYMFYITNLNISLQSVINFANSANISYAFYNNCLCLKKVTPILQCSSNTSFANTTFSSCSSLEDVKIKYLKSNIFFSGCARLNYESIKYLIDNASNTNAITITVHATTYGYLMGTATPTTQVGGTSAQWQQIVTDATAKNISFASA